MRYVRRNITRVEQPRPPWEWRPEWPTEAPRTCLSHYKQPVYIRRGEHLLLAGKFDWLLRLYQHTGVSDASVVQDGHVLYDVDREWVPAKKIADWLEYVDNRHEIVFRISKKEAITEGQYIETDDGPRFAVPLDAYTAHERD